MSISSEFDVFARKPILTTVLEMIDTVCKPIAPVEQSDLEFIITDDLETYINLDIKLYIRGKLISGYGKDLDTTEFTAVTNNFLHSLISQCSVTLYGVSITQASELYHYRSYSRPFCPKASMLPHIILQIRSGISTRVIWFPVTRPPPMLKKQFL